MQNQHLSSVEDWAFCLLSVCLQMLFAGWLKTPVHVVSQCTYRHRRKNQGGGGSTPTARAMPIHAVLGLTMRYHMNN